MVGLAEEGARPPALRPSQAAVFAIHLRAFLFLRALHFFEHDAPVFRRRAARRAGATCTVTKYDPSLEFNEFRVGKPTCPETAIRPKILMANRDLDTHQSIRHALAACAGGLARRPWNIFVRSSGTCALLEDCTLIADVFEHL